MSAGLSVAIVTKNEEKHLARALGSVAFADEIVLVDSGSTDRTLEIAREFGCRIIEREWPGFRAQKTFAMEQTTREWILGLDGDEEITPELAQSIKSVVSGEKTGYDAYSFARLTRFVDRWMRHGGWYPDLQIRLIRRGAAVYGEHPVHSAPEPFARPGRLSGDMLHYSFESVSDYVTRMNTYSSVSARWELERGRIKRVSGYMLAWSLVRKFLEVYVYKQGFLDGKHGFVVAWLSAYGVFLRYAKIKWPEPDA